MIDKRFTVPILLYINSTGNWPLFSDSYASADRFSASFEQSVKAWLHSSITIIGKTTSVTQDPLLLVQKGIFLNIYPSISIIIVRCLVSFFLFTHVRFFGGAIISNGSKLVSCKQSLRISIQTISL